MCKANALKYGKPNNIKAGNCIKPAPPPAMAEKKFEKNDVTNINKYSRYEKLLFICRSIKNNSSLMKLILFSTE